MNSLPAIYTVEDIYSVAVPNIADKKH